MRLSKALIAVCAVATFGLTGCNMNSDLGSTFGGLNIPGVNDAMKVLSITDTQPEWRLTIQQCDNFLATTPEEFFKQASVTNQPIKEAYLDVFNAQLSSCNIKTKFAMNEAAQILNEEVSHVKGLINGNASTANKLALASEAARVYADVQFLQEMIDGQQTRIANSNAIYNAIKNDKKLKIHSKANWQKIQNEYKKTIADTANTATSFTDIVSNLQEGVQLFNILKN